MKLRLELPAPQPPAAGYEGAVLLGLLAAPENATHFEADVQLEAALPYRSSAVTVSLNDEPAVCVPGFESVK